MIDIGTGPPVVLIPGIQGRYEWMQPAIHALATRTRVISFSLAGEPGTDARFSDAPGVEGYLAQIDHVLDERRLERVTVCGVSFGGLIALRYASTRPKRVSALVLVSTPGPRWSPSAQIRTCMRHPWVLFPLFGVGASRRAWQEVRETFPVWRERVGALARYARLVVRAPASPPRMSRRAELAVRFAFEEDCSAISAPTLVITGDAALDRVVPTATTLEYTRLIRQARPARLELTGHLGVITRPDRFAELVAAFALEQAGDLDQPGNDRHGSLALAGPKQGTQQGSNLNSKMEMKTSTS